MGRKKDRVTEELCKEFKFILQYTEKRKDKPIWMQSAEEQQGENNKKAFLSDQCKEIKGNNRMERLEISSRKLDIPREFFMQTWAQ